MKTQGFSRSVYDFLIYIKQMNDEIFNFIILILYADDVLILAKNQSNFKKCKNKLKFAFKMKDLEELKRILCMEIHRNLMKKRL